MKDKTAIVSVCMPTYNYAQFISDAIDSVRSQTFTDFELIVIDNCSTDNTQDIVAEYARVDQRIKYVRNEANFGLLGNLNRCLQLGSGEYIKILCSDDVLDSTCLEKMVKAFRTNPDVVLVSCSRLLVDSSLKPIIELSYSKKYQVLKGTHVIKQCLFKGNLIGEPSAVLFRRKDVTRGFDASYSQLVDLDMWFGLLEKGNFVFIPESLCKFRQHGGQGTKESLKTMSFLKDEEKLFNDYIKKPYVHYSFLNVLDWKFRMAFNVWGFRSIYNNRAGTRETINRYVNYYLFLATLPIVFALKIAPGALKGITKKIAMKFHLNNRLK